MRYRIKIWMLRAQLLWLKVQIRIANALTRLCRKRLEQLQKDVLDYRKITTGQFARLLGVNKSTVEGWLKPDGLKGMRVQRLQTICRMLDCGVLIDEDGLTLEVYGRKE